MRGQIQCVEMTTNRQSRISCVTRDGANAEEERWNDMSGETRFEWWNTRDKEMSMRYEETRRLGEQIQGEIEASQERTKKRHNVRIPTHPSSEIAVEACTESS